MTVNKAIEILDKVYDDTMEFRQVFSVSDDIDIVNDELIALLTAIDALKEKVNSVYNNVWPSCPAPSSPIPFSVAGSDCGISYHEEYDRDCKYYNEEHDMGATIPICTKYDKFGDFNCNECYKYKR